MLERLKREPAVVIGSIAAVILAAIQAAAGENLLPANIADIVAKALDPTGGWAIPIIVAIITRFFVSPAPNPGL